MAILLIFLLVEDKPSEQPVLAVCCKETGVRGPDHHHPGTRPQDNAQRVKVSDFVIPSWSSTFFQYPHDSRHGKGPKNMGMVPYVPLRHYHIE